MKTLPDNTIAELANELDVEEEAIKTNMMKKIKKMPIKKQPQKQKIKIHKMENRNSTNF